MVCQDLRPRNVRAELVCVIKVKREYSEDVETDSDSDIAPDESNIQGVLRNNLPDPQKCCCLPYFWGHPMELSLHVRECHVAFISLGGRSSIYFSVDTLTLHDYFR